MLDQTGSIVCGCTIRPHGLTCLRRTGVLLEQRLNCNFSGLRMVMRMLINYSEIKWIFFLLINVVILYFLVADMNDIDHDECDDVLCSDIDDRASETDSKKEGSRGTSRGSSNESKSHGNSSKPRR